MPRSESNINEDEDAFNPKKVTLDPNDLTYVLDVGSGEIGFYVFYQDMSTYDVKMEAKKKYKFVNKMDFISQFYH